MAEDASLAFMTVAELGQAYRRRTLSPVELLDATLARIARSNTSLNAVYYVDPEGARRQAAASEARFARGTPLGPVDGIPTTMKDALPTMGMPSFRGSASTDDSGTIYAFNAPVTDRLLEAGCVIMGKSTMCDFGILAAGVSSRHGLTRNPWNTDRNPGGSSSGAAASVAAGLSPMAIGTDIVGSIRLPASFCGLVGFKPSQGRVPYFPVSSSVLAAGPLAWTVEDVALTMGVIARTDARNREDLPPMGDPLACLDESRSRSGRIRLLSRLGFGVPPSDDVWAAVRRVATQLASLGIDVIEDDAPFEADAAAPAELFYQTRSLAELDLASEARQRLSPVVGAWCAAARGLPATTLSTAVAGMAQLRARAMQLVADVDYLLLPSTPTVAYAADRVSPEGYGLFDAWCNTFLFNLTEQPALSLNCGFDAAGMPIGLQIVGHRFDDVGVLAFGRLVEHVLALPRRRPGDVCSLVAQKDKAGSSWTPHAPSTSASPLSNLQDPQRIASRS